MLIIHHTHELPISFTHAHDSYEIQYCVSGSCTYLFSTPTSDGTFIEKRINSGFLIFTPKSVPHGIKNVKYPYDRYFAQFSENDLFGIQGSTDILSKLLIQSDKLSPIIWDLSANHEIFDKIFENAYNGFMSDCQNKQWNYMYLTCHTALLFCEINRCYPMYFAHEGLDEQAPIVSAVKQYLDEHFSETIKLSDLAEKMHFSQNYLTRKFTQQIGMSPRQYLTQKRLSMARNNLVSTTSSIQDIATNNGFGDVNFFIRLFKETYGITPKQYQQEMRITP